MTNTFPFTTKTRDGRVAHVLGVTEAPNYLLIGYVEPAFPTSWSRAGRFLRHSVNSHPLDLVDVPALPLAPLPGNRYRTRDGSIAHVTHLSHHSSDAKYPLFGVVITASGEHYHQTWTAEGSVYTDLPGEDHDLIEEVTE